MAQPAQKSPSTHSRAKTVSDNIGMPQTTSKAMISELRKVLKRLRYPLEVMLVCARWDAAYPLSFGHLEEMIAKSAGAVKPCLQQISSTAWLSDLQ